MICGISKGEAVWESCLCCGFDLRKFGRSQENIQLKGGSRGVERVVTPHFELTHKKNIRRKLPAHIFW